MAFRQNLKKTTTTTTKNQTTHIKPEQAFWYTKLTCAPRRYPLPMHSPQWFRARLPIDLAGSVGFAEMRHAMERQITTARIVLKGQKKNMHIHTWTYQQSVLLKQPRVSQPDDHAVNPPYSTTCACRYIRIYAYAYVYA